MSNIDNTARNPPLNAYNNAQPAGGVGGNLQTDNPRYPGEVAGNNFRNNRDEPAHARNERPNRHIFSRFSDLLKCLSPRRTREPRLLFPGGLHVLRDGPARPPAAIKPTRVPQHDDHTMRLARVSLGSVDADRPIDTSNQTRLRSRPTGGMDANAIRNSEQFDAAIEKEIDADGEKEILREKIQLTELTLPTKLREKWEGIVGSTLVDRQPVDKSNRKALALLAELDRGSSDKMHTESADHNATTAQGARENAAVGDDIDHDDGLPPSGNAAAAKRRGRAEPDIKLRTGKGDGALKAAAPFDFDEVTASVDASLKKLGEDFEF